MGKGFALLLSLLPVTTGKKWDLSQYLSVSHTLDFYMQIVWERATLSQNLSSFLLFKVFFS